MVRMRIKAVDSPQASSLPRVRAQGGAISAYKPSFVERPEGAARIHRPAAVGPDRGTVSGRPSGRDSPDRGIPGDRSPPWRAQTPEQNAAPNLARPGGPPAPGPAAGVDPGPPWVGPTGERATPAGGSRCGKGHRPGVRSTAPTAVSPRARQGSTPRQRPQCAQPRRRREGPRNLRAPPPGQAPAVRPPGPISSIAHRRAKPTTRDQDRKPLRAAPRRGGRRPHCGDGRGPLSGQACRPRRKPPKLPKPRPPTLPRLVGRMRTATDAPPRASVTELERLSPDLAGSNEGAGSRTWVTPEVVGFTGPPGAASRPSSTPIRRTCAQGGKKRRHHRRRPLEPGIGRRHPRRSDPHAGDP